MKYLFLVLAMFITTSCSSEDAEKLIGNWRFESPKYECLLLASFDEDTNFQFDTVCEFTDQTLGADLLRGTYQVDGNILTLTARQSSCPQSVVNKVSRSEFSVTDTILRIKDNERLVQFERNDSVGTGSGAITYGCLDLTAEDVFTPGPLVSL